MANHNRRIQNKAARSVYCLSVLLTASLAGIACSSSSPGDDGHGGSINISVTGGTGSGATGSDASGSPGTDPGQGGSGNGTSTGAGGVRSSGTGGSTATAGTTTTTSATACDNGKDDDGDGLIDGFDPECTGPLDDDEGTFATGIPGDNVDPKWQDCFFDGNSGAGDDGCRYSTKCLTGELPQTDAACSVTDSCIKFCAKLTQNGCDCFGCCTVQLPDGSSIDVTEKATCSVANVGDEKACPRCTKSTQCGNECGECELCAGKTLADLPASCSPPVGTGGSPGAGGAPGTGGAINVGGTGGSVSNTCDGGEKVCGPGLAPCSSAEYCSFGCCIPAVR